MSKERLLSFSDSVVATVLTLLVFQIAVPATQNFSGLWAMRHIFEAYIVTFVFIAVIWVTHHQLFQLADKINYTIVWADLFWLFWLTLCPFVTAWVGKYPMSFWPEMVYAIVFSMWSISFAVLAHFTIKFAGPNSHVAWAYRGDHRTNITYAINMTLIIGVFFFPPSAIIGRFLVSALWALPNRRITAALKMKNNYKITSKDEEEIKKTKRHKKDSDN